MLQQVLRILLYFVISCLANYIYPGVNYVTQGILLIALWGTWFQNNRNWEFAQRYGKYFNWFGALALLNGACFIASKYM